MPQRVRRVCGCAVVLLGGGVPWAPVEASSRGPNVVLVMTDDQSIADFGVNGNEVIRTPHIDRLASQSASFTQFYVSPVCSATRASLLTGRYNYRTRVVDTWLGRSMMDPDEVTLAEMLSGAGYATGIFGKWHLGDCYPMRPNDQGFQESLVHRGGGLAQPSEPIGNNRRYTDPILIRNGEETPTEGYCTDVYFEEATRFIRESAADGKRFFVYLPTNAPHAPYHDVPEELLAEYQGKADRLRTLLPDGPTASEKVVDDLARIAAMITNIDENVGRLRGFLEAEGFAEDTMFLFLIDNGPAPRRFARGLKGRKCEVTEAGIRSPLWIHWPAGGLTAPITRDEIAAHLDLTPTILDACGVEPAPGARIDGRSLLPLMRGEAAEWPDREIVIQAHRGDEPVRYHNFMIRDPRWKLTNPSGFHHKELPTPPEFELYDMREDFGEKRSVADRHPEVVERLKGAYDAWFDDVSSTREDNYAPPRIHLGSPHEREAALTRNDWRGESWSSKTIGRWLVRVVTAGEYRVVVHLEEDAEKERVVVEIGGVTRSLPAVEGTKATFEKLPLSVGDCDLRAWVEGDRPRGAYQVMVSLVETP